MVNWPTGRWDLGLVKAGLSDISPSKWASPSSWGEGGTDYTEREECDAADPVIGTREMGRARQSGCRAVEVLRRDSGNEGSAGVTAG
jgi:hypothetical protein